MTGREAMPNSIISADEQLNYTKQSRYEIGRLGNVQIMEFPKESFSSP